MQDDCYMISRDGWKLSYTFAKKRTTYEELACDLLPVDIVLCAFFADEKKQVETLRGHVEQIQAKIDQHVEDHPEAFGEICENFTESNFKKDRTAYKKENADIPKEITDAWKTYDTYIAERKMKTKEVSKAIDTLTAKVIEKYGALTEGEICQLVVHNKWTETLMNRAKSELKRVSQQMTADILALADRYADPLPALESDVEAYRKAVADDLRSMGLTF